MMTHASAGQMLAYVEAESDALEGLLKIFLALVEHGVAEAEEARLLALPRSYLPIAQAARLLSCLALARSAASTIID